MRRQSDYDVRNLWAGVNRLRLSQMRVHWQAILDWKWRQAYTEPKGSWDDHGEVWNRDGHAVVYTSHPYNFGEQEIDQLRKVERDFGVEVQVFPPDSSWYYPGRTWLVALWAPGVECAPRIATRTLPLSRWRHPNPARA